MSDSNTMSTKTSVVYVWSASDQQKYQKYQEIARWLLAPIILFGLLIFIVTVWAFIEFRDCSWKIAPPTVSYPVLIIFMILSIIIFLLCAFGLFVFLKEDSKQMGQFIRFMIIFSLLSVILMIILWIYTVYAQDGRLSNDTLQLSYSCLTEVAQCWDRIQEMHSCCGWNSAKDWKNIPHSCCDYFINYGHEICTKCKNDKGIPLEAAFQEGCKNHLSSRSLIYIIFASLSWVIVVILFLAVIFVAIHLLRGLKIKEKLKPIVGE